MFRQFAALALAVLVVVPAFAQERLEVFTVVGGQPRLVEVDATVRGFGDVLRVTPLTHVPTGATHVAVAVAGGRYLAWAGASANHSGDDLFAFDRRSRTVSIQSHLLPPPSPGWFPPSYTILAADSHQPRLFVLEFFIDRLGGAATYSIWMIDLRQGAPVKLASRSTGITGVAYAAEVDELFIFSIGVDDRSEMVVVNATTGTELRHGEVPTLLYKPFTEPRGRVVWGYGSSFMSIDGRTGEVLGRAPATGDAVLDIDRTAIVGIEGLGDFIVALDPVTLNLLGRLRIEPQLPGPRGIDSSAWVLPGRWMTGAYVVRSETRLANPTCNAIRASALEPSGLIRASTDILAALGSGGEGPCYVRPWVFRSPFAPKALAATRSGSDVTMTWQDPGDTVEFELEFGFAPGQRAGAIRVGHTMPITIPAVPPGVYYVRVKAINEVGGSPASNEVRVVVP